MGNHTTKLGIDSKTHILQFIPSSLLFLTQQPKNKIIYQYTTEKIQKKVNLKTDYLIDIIHTFVCKKFFTGKESINFSSSILQDRYGMNYKAYLQFLLDNNILILKANHCASKWSRKYAMTVPITKNNIIRFKNTNPFLREKWIARFIEDDLQLNDKRINPEVKKALINDLKYINLDFDMAAEVLLREYENNELSEEAYLKNQISIESIKDGSLFYIEDKYGRFHTNFTVLKKIIRKNFLTIDGEEVEELDIKNSQPTLLAVVLKEHAFDVEFPEEYNKFLNAVKTNTLYSQIKGSANYTRKECKEILYCVFFGNNKKYGGKGWNKLFKNLYPNIYNWIVQYKKGKHHSILAHELQGRESKLIFDKICFKLKREIPAIKLFTVHDAIFFPKKYKEKVSEIFYHYVDCLFA